MRGWWLAAVVVASGCVDHDLVRCGDLFCPASTQCVPTGCATAEQVAACEGKADGDECDTRVNVQGHCLQGTCLDTICGDNIVEFGEACDDGNIIGGDGCSERCTSNETCGNGVLDLSYAEQCDEGIAYLGGDGCSSTCGVEIDVWRDLTPNGIPSRENHVMVYDPVRGALVVFGGQSEEGILGDTWTYAGGNWTREPGQGPPARRNAIMVYDSTAQRAILFGGHDGDTSLDDTWAWDGFTWTPLSPATMPPRRHRAAAAYDSTRQQLILFGGANEQTPALDDTWLWTGTNWSPLTPNTRPQGRRDHAMAYDAARNRIVLYGGGDPSQEFRSTFHWNGANWVLQDVPIGERPAADLHVTLTYDEGRQRVILFGGRDASANNEQFTTWRWQPDIATATGSWIRYDVGAHPTARQNAASAYLPGLGVVVHGGADRSSQRLGDLWRFDDSPATWRQLTPTTRPYMYRPAITYDPAAGRSLVWSGVNGALWYWDGQVWTSAGLTSSPEPGAYTGYGFVYDEARRQGVLFGGRSFGGTRTDDTWILDATGWSRVMPATRPPMGDAAFIYDAKRATVVMVLEPATPTTTLQTWEWNGINWTPLASATPAPPTRADFGIAYDRERDRLVLFGGVAASEALGDTWEWDGTAWQALSPAVSPTTRSGLVLVYDIARKRTLLAGGVDGSNLSDTWEWNGTSWTKRPDLTTPPAQSFAAATYDRARREVLVVSPYGYVTTWSHAFEPLETPVESCFVATDDVDGDGRAGCLDPDCWGRCAPFCVPGQACDSTQPYCGDGVCGAVEDHLLCPQDGCTP